MQLVWGCITMLCCLLLWASLFLEAVDFTLMKWDIFLLLRNKGNFILFLIFHWIISSRLVQKLKC